MKLYSSINLCALSIMTLAACATPTSNGSPLEKTEADQKTATQDILTKGLSARNLARGDCGLFVWSANQNRRFILFSQSQKGKALWAGPSGEAELKITETSGQVFQQQYTQQSFMLHSKVKETQIQDKPVQPNLKLALRNIENLIDSTRFKGGTLAQTTTDGTQRVIPVVALSTCR